jgi:predicted O-methyltransferase YrrM
VVTVRDVFSRSHSLRRFGSSKKIVVGSSTTSIKSLRKTLDMPRPMKFDMVFLDHLKPLYTIDLKVLEEEGLVGRVGAFDCVLGRS